MCCKLTISNLDPDLAEAMLAIGLFLPLDKPLTWRRDLPEEGTSVFASFVLDQLQLQIQPAISNIDHHAEKRIAASVYFEMAAKFAEKVGGTITQRAQVAGCRIEGSTNADLIVARYPDQPLMFDHVCPGFQAVILGEAA